MHLITLRIISNISVLVIAATLSTVGAGKCLPERLESNRSDRDPLVGEGNWPIGQILMKGNPFWSGRKPCPLWLSGGSRRGKMGKEKGRDTTD